MNKRFFFSKLAWTNLKKNSQMYLPFMLTSIISVMMYYIMHALSLDPGLENMRGSDPLILILSLAKWIVAIFVCIFLFYTNSFLVKRRKKEFGIFNILGMEKQHISKVMMWETLYTALISLSAGLIMGIIFSKLLYLVLLYLLQFEVTLGFFVPFRAVLQTVLLFGVIFFVIFLNTIRQVHLSDPMALLIGGKAGEREPRTKWIMTLFGVVCLGAGYYIALTTESPLEALSLFFVAVLLVMAGTYSLFASGSIALLKILRKNKKYYYQTKHFTTISGMIYRMKQNAVGLANICILSTAVLIMISTTASLYIGVEDAIHTRYTNDVAYYGQYLSEGDKKEVKALIQEEIGKAGYTENNVQAYRYQYLLGYMDGIKFAEANNSMVGADMTAIICMTLDEYNEMEGKKEELKENEILIHSSKTQYDEKNIAFGNKEFDIKKHLDDVGGAGAEQAMLRQSYVVVLKDEEVLKNIYKEYSFEYEGMSYYYGFDLQAEPDDQMELARRISEVLSEAGYGGYTESMEANRQDIYSMYGGLLFIGLFLGILFMMATVLIIYYKQVSEGYDDKERFEIMQKVGMSKKEVRSAIRSQVLTVFFLPLITACIHVAAAFKVLTKLMFIMNLTNVSLYIWCTIGTAAVFALIYGIIYLLTAKVYYKIVS